MPYKKSDVSAEFGLGDSEGTVTLAIRERLAGAYKGLHANRPAALDMTATLLAGVHDGLAGRMRTICLAAGIGDKGYQHINEGVNGDGISVAVLMVLLEAAPASVVPAIADVLDGLGYEVRRKAAARPVTSVFEASAHVSEKVGRLQATAFRAVSDGVIDKEEARDIRHDIADLKEVVRELEAHAGVAK